MKKKIEQLLGGKFEYGQPSLLFSPERISATVKAGEIIRGEVHLGAGDDRRIRGFVTSSNRRVVPEAGEFSGTAVCLPYQIDSTGMNSGDKIAGWLCFTTNIGEYKLPFCVEAKKEEIRTSAGEIKSMDAFREVAKTDFSAAYNIFKDSHFPLILGEATQKQKAMYEGLCTGAVTYQHLEEFLIGMDRKEPVRISLKETEAEFYEVRETVQESFGIQKSGWGHLRLEIETRGDFLETDKQVVMDEDFIGSSFRVMYVINWEKLGKNCRSGEIVVRSPYQELVYRVRASRERKLRVNVNTVQKRHRLELLRDYLEYCCGRMEQKAWAGSCHFVLNQLKEAGCAYPEYQMWEAFVLYQEGNTEAAVKILKGYQDKSFTVEELELAGVYLYLCHLTGLYSDKARTIHRLESFYVQKEDSFLLFYLLLKLDSTYQNTPSKAIYMMKQQFERGCRSPFLYLEAWQYVMQDLTLLHRLGDFWSQVFVCAGRNGLLTQELVMRMAYLSGFEKKFTRSLYRALVMGYEEYPSDDVLEAICKYIMKGNPRNPEYFRWFSMAVEQGLRLTRLYEYYVETMDTSYQRELPKPLLMYFTYNDDSLGDAKKAYVYASVVLHKEQEPQIYAAYREKIKSFALRKSREGSIDENYAVLYQELLEEITDGEEAFRIAEKMFTCRLFCDDKKVRQVIVRHNQLLREEVYPCLHGVAYPRIYTEDAVIIFQDEKQRRYVSTVDYNLSRLMDEKSYVEKLLGMGIREKGLLLHYCARREISEENLDLFQDLADSGDFAETCRKTVRREILEYYSLHEHGENLDRYLKQLDYQEYALVNRRMLLEVLINRRMFYQAASLVAEFGYEELDVLNLLKLTSRMILEGDMAEDRELLAWAFEVYRNGKYDEVILHYLMKYRYGSLDELLAIWKSAVGFELDTYDLEERILCLLMFTSDYRKEGETILEAYVRHAGRERVIGAYLTQVAYGAFVKEYPVSPYVKKCLLHAWKCRWPVNRVCRMALLKGIAKDRTKNGKDPEMEKELLAECMKDGMFFAFFRKLSPELLSPYHLDDKVYVEYHTAPEDSVILYYALDTGLGSEPEYKAEPVRNVYEGIFVKAFTLFYGETLHYYFAVKKDGKIKKTTERVISMNKVEGTPLSKYYLLNQILAARRLGKDQEAVLKLRQYLRQEQYMKEMFSIERESKK